MDELNWKSESRPVENAVYRIADKGKAAIAAVVVGLLVVGFVVGYLLSSMGSEDPVVENTANPVLQEQGARYALIDTGDSPGLTVAGTVDANGTAVEFDSTYRTDGSAGTSTVTADDTEGTIVINPRGIFLDNSNGILQAVGVTDPTGEWTRLDAEYPLAAVFPDLRVVSENLEGITVDGDTVTAGSTSVTVTDEGTVDSFTNQNVDVTSVSALDDSTTGEIAGDAGRVIGSVSADGAYNR